MVAVKKSGLIILCLSLAVLSLLSIFAIITGSSAKASEVLEPQAVVNLQPEIVITPTACWSLTLYPDGLLTQTLWISNTGNNPLTYTIYEMSAPVRLAGFSLRPELNRKIDPDAQSQVASQKRAQVIIYLRELPDLTPAYSIPDKAARGRYVYSRLLETASHSQGLFDWLDPRAPSLNAC